MNGSFKLKRISDGKEFPLSVISLLVGRSDSCDITVTQGHPSREHARIAERDGAVLVEDLHSTNGTFVNNQKIVSSAILRVGDVVKFGDESFSVQSQSAPDATVLMRSLGGASQASATVMDDDEDDDIDSTKILQMYSLPPGWEEEAGFTSEIGKLDERKKAAIDRYIDKFSQSLRGRTGIFLIFFSDDNPPLIKSLVVTPNKTKWVFGRSSQCDFTIDDPCISKRHATVSYDSDTWLIEDLDSTNGVSLKGSKQKKVELLDNMTLEISAVEVLVRYVK